MRDVVLYYILNTYFEFFSSILSIYNDFKKLYKYYKIKFNIIFDQITIVGLNILKTESILFNSSMIDQYSISDITDNWLTSDDSALDSQLTTGGFKVFLSNRSTSHRGGG